ncbi:MAG: hypothetical protein JEY99_19760 [Spirochaetales bacterium]|nr:hypothetical protein [Spirochaetales bacterium]
MQKILSQKTIIYLILVLTLQAGVFSQSSPFLTRPESDFKFPESYEIRQKLESWIHAPVNEARAASMGVFRQSSDGSMVRVRTEDTTAFFYQLFLIEEDYSYPVARRGNFVIKRESNDGSFLQVKIFLRDDPGSFLRIFPYGERTVLDGYLLGKKIYGNIVLPLTISQVFTSPLEHVMEMTSARIDWSVYDAPPPASLSRNKIDVMNQIRREIDRLYDCDDGAMDADGNYVYIETLKAQETTPGGFNCSGFVKWIADGFVLPITGELMDIDSLKLKHPGIRGNSWSEFSEEARDPFFGLDWTRNIALTLAALRGESGITLRTENGPGSFESADVREVPFFSYAEDIGWGVADLEPILYLLAKSEPGNFYIGSFNISYGEDQVLRQHTHVAALFPYFSALGEFKVAVFERNKETSLDSLNARYANDFVHLVRIQTKGEFQLP